MCAAVFNCVISGNGYRASRACPQPSVPPHCAEASGFSHGGQRKDGVLLKLSAALSQQASQCLFSAGRQRCREGCNKVRGWSRQEGRESWRQRKSSGCRHHGRDEKNVVLSFPSNTTQYINSTTASGLDNQQEE